MNQRIEGRGSSFLLTAPMDDPLEVIAAVEKLTKIVLAAAGFVKITKHMPTWIKIVRESDVDIWGLLMKLFLFFIVILIAWRTSLRDLWQAGRLEIQAKMELKLNDYSCKFRGWAQDFVVGIKDHKILGAMRDKIHPMPVSLAKRMKPKRQERQWIFLSQLDGLWKKLAGKRNGKAIRNTMPRIQDSHVALAAVSEWDRVRLMEIVKAHEEKTQTPRFGTMPPLEMDQARSEDELTLDYYRRANQIRQERYKRDTLLDASSSYYRPLPSSSLSISDSPHLTSFRSHLSFAKLPQWRPSL